MTLPSIILGLLISLLIGALFHLWRDGGLGRLMFFLALSVVGFACGQWVGVWRNWMFFPLGPLDLGLAVLGSFVFLGVGYWLSLVELHRPGSTKDEV
jgi:hypothetical protein